MKSQRLRELFDPVLIRMEMPWSRATRVFHPPVSNLRQASPGPATDSTTLAVGSDARYVTLTAHPDAPSSPPGVQLATSAVLADITSGMGRDATANDEPEETAVNFVGFVDSKVPAVQWDLCNVGSDYTFLLRAFGAPTRGRLILLEPRANHRRPRVIRVRCRRQIDTPLASSLANPTQQPVCTSQAKISSAGTLLAQARQR